VAAGTIVKYAFVFLAKCGGFVSAGMPLMTCGHYFLKLSGAPGYDSVTFLSTVSVGALGGLLMTIPMTILLWIIMNPPSCSLPTFNSRSKDTDNGSTTDQEGTVVAEEDGSETDKLPFSVGAAVVQILASIASVVGLGAGTGYFGSAVLNATGHNVLGVLEATRAGAVGAAILGPGVLILVLLLSLCCGGTAILALLLARSKEPDTESKTEKLPDAKV
jgi:hypothetical protein